MKQMMGMVIITGFLVVTADLEAVERRLDRVRTKDGPTPNIVLTTGPQLLAVTDDGTPLPALNAVPPGPMEPVASPAPPLPCRCRRRQPRDKWRREVRPCLWSRRRHFFRV